MKPTSLEKASILGHNIICDSDYRLKIGLCPQKDVLFKQLTPREHLELYSRLKEIPEADIIPEINKRLIQLGLGFIFYALLYY